MIAHFAGGVLMLVAKVIGEPMRGHLDAVLSVVHSPDDVTIVSRSSDGIVMGNLQTSDLQLTGPLHCVLP